MKKQSFLYGPHAIHNSILDVHTTYFTKYKISLAPFDVFIASVGKIHKNKSIFMSFIWLSFDWLHILDSERFYDVNKNVYAM